MNFWQRVQAGEIPDDQIEDAFDDEVDAWHDVECDGCTMSRNNPKCPVHGDVIHLHDHLGMTFDEFARWARSPRAEIKKMRKS